MLYSRSLFGIHFKYSSVHVHAKLPNYPFPATFSPTLATKACSWGLWVCFCFVCKFRPSLSLCAIGSLFFFWKTLTYSFLIWSSSQFCEVHGSGTVTWKMKMSVYRFTHTHTLHTYFGVQSRIQIYSCIFTASFPKASTEQAQVAKLGRFRRSFISRPVMASPPFCRKTCLWLLALQRSQRGIYKFHIVNSSYWKSSATGNESNLAIPTWRSESRERMPENKVTLQKTESQLGHRYLTSRISVCVHAHWLQLCPTLCDPMDLSPPGSSVHGILQASILEWVAMPSVGEGKISLSLLADVVPKAFHHIIALMPLALSEDSVHSLSRLSVFIKPPLPQSEGEFMLSPPPMVFRLAVQDSSCWAVKLRRWGFPNGSVDKESAGNAGDVGLILGQEDPWEEEMATHSSILAWRIPWTEEPGGLQSRVAKSWTWLSNCNTF